MTFHHDNLQIVIIIIQYLENLIITIYLRQLYLDSLYLDYLYLDYLYLDYLYLDHLYLDYQLGRYREVKLVLNRTICKIAPMGATPVKVYQRKSILQGRSYLVVTRAL